MVRTLYKALKKEIRENIRKRYHYTCQRCGKKFPKSGKEKLTIIMETKNPIAVNVTTRLS